MNLTLEDIWKKWNISDFDDPTPSPSEVRKMELELYTPRYVDIVTNIILFIIGAFPNLQVLILLIANKLWNSSKHHFLLLNLAVADSIVMFIMIPGEVIKLSLVSWRADNLTCKIFQFMRVFGLYESSFILVCISFDRYQAVINPFDYQSSGKSIKIMAICSWILSFILSIPQLIVYSIAGHRFVTSFYVCTVWISDPQLHRAYNVSSLTMMYLLPLAIMAACYLRICFKTMDRPTFMSSVSATQRMHNSSSVRERTSNEKIDRRMCEELEDRSITHDSVCRDNIKRNANASGEEDLNHFEKVEEEEEVTVTLDTSFGGEKVDEMENILRRGNLEKEKVMEPNGRFIGQERDTDIEGQNVSVSMHVIVDDLRDGKRLEYDGSIPDAALVNVSMDSNLCSSNEPMNYDPHGHTMEMDKSCRKFCTSSAAEWSAGSLRRSNKSNRNDLSYEAMEMKEAVKWNENYRRETEKVNEEYRIAHRKGSKGSIIECKPMDGGHQPMAHCSKVSNSSGDKLLHPAKNITFDECNPCPRHSPHHELNTRSSVEVTQIEASRTASIDHLQKVAKSVDSVKGHHNLNQTTNRGTSTLTERQERNKKRILKQSFTIVITYMLCWAPYAFMSLWHQIDEESAYDVPDVIAYLFFSLVVANSAFNPYIYGRFLREQVAARHL